MSERSDEFQTGAYQVNVPYYSGPQKRYAYVSNKEGTEGAVAEMYPAQYDFTDYTNNAHAWAHENAAPGGQIPLFNQDITPPTISYVASTEGGRVGSQKLLAHMVKESERNYGVRPTADYNLSEKASAMVNKAIKAGVIPGLRNTTPGRLHNPAYDDSNDMDYSAGKSRMQELRFQHGDNPKSFTPIPESRVNQDTQEILRQLRGKAEPTTAQDSLASRQGVNPWVQQSLFSKAARPPK